MGLKTAYLVIFTIGFTLGPANGRPCIFSSYQGSNYDYVKHATNAINGMSSWIGQIQKGLDASKAAKTAGSSGSYNYITQATNAINGMSSWIGKMQKKLDDSRAAKAGSQTPGVSVWDNLTNLGEKTTNQVINYGGKLANNVLSGISNWFSKPQKPTASQSSQSPSPAINIWNTVTDLGEKAKDTMNNAFEYGKDVANKALSGISDWFSPKSQAPKVPVTPSMPGSVSIFNVASQTQTQTQPQIPSPANTGISGWWSLKPQGTSAPPTPQVPATPAVPVNIFNVASQTQTQTQPQAPSPVNTGWWSSKLQAPPVPQVSATPAVPVSIVNIASQSSSQPQTPASPATSIWNTMTNVGEKAKQNIDYIYDYGKDLASKTYTGITDWWYSKPQGTSAPQAPQVPANPGVSSSVSIVNTVSQTPTQTQTPSPATSFWNTVTNLGEKAKDNIGSLYDYGKDLASKTYTGISDWWYSKPQETAPPQAPASPAVPDSGIVYTPPQTQPQPQVAAPGIIMTDMEGQTQYNIDQHELTPPAYPGLSIPQVTYVVQNSQVPGTAGEQGFGSLDIKTKIKLHKAHSRDRHFMKHYCRHQGINDPKCISGYNYQ